MNQGAEVNYSILHFCRNCLDLKFVEICPTIKKKTFYNLYYTCSLIWDEFVVRTHAHVLIHLRQR